VLNLGFNIDYIEEIWKQHMQGKKNYSRLLGLLATFELFLENFCGDQMKAQNMGEEEKSVAEEELYE
jgi:hypothetical protein